MPVEDRGRPRPGSGTLGFMLVHDPLPPGWRRLLRRAVLDHALAEQRRHFHPMVHVGHPGHGEASFAVSPGMRFDHGLRVDVVAALCRRARLAEHLPTLVWVTRPGPLELEDVDAAWLAAARQAFGESELPLTYVVVTRRGWWDPRSGNRRTWRRIRPRCGPFDAG